MIDQSQIYHQILVSSGSVLSLSALIQMIGSNWSFRS